MMIKRFFFQLSIILIVFFSVFNANAENEEIEVLPDSVSYKVSLDEIEIISNPKTNIPLTNFPGSVSVIGKKQIEQNHIVSVKDISTLVPNLFVPDYGSRLISAMYIRGIGSRINSPAVGLNVDDVPYLDKSAFDFDFYDVEKVEVFRGPQGTIFGRNTMAGLVNVYTTSPFDKQGLKVRMGVANYDAYNVSALYKEKINEKFALSVGANYNTHRGYFTNEYTGKSCGDEEVVGGNVKLQFRPNENLDITLSSIYEYSNQDGYPYRGYNKQTQEVSPVNYDGESGYRRSLSNTALKLAYTHEKFILNSVTSYQFLDDDMRLDQDFTTYRDFALQQKQKQNAVTQELVMRSPQTKRGWDWLAGLFGFYSHLDMDSPVTFFDEGLHYMVEAPFNKMYEQISSRSGFKGPNPLTLTLDKDAPLFIDGDYKTPSWGASAFIQSTYNNLFVDGLSLTVGMRLEYEKIKLNHVTASTRDMTGSLNGSIKVGNMPFPIPINEPVSATLALSGDEEMDFLEFLPRFEVEYKVSESIFTYASVARGYRAGGYNYQAFSNILRQEMIVGATGKYALMMPASMTQPVDVNAMISYAPEHSWNYELGLHCDFSEQQLAFDAAVFFVDCKDQQISVVEGFGRVTKNSGRTHSAGVELAMRYSPVKNLSLSAAYGYTHATFRENYDGKVSYQGNFVPFSPAHNLSLNAGYTLEVNKKRLDKVMFNVGMTGQGRLYWTEKNDVWQNFYGLLNADITLTKGPVSVSVWGKNLTATDYQAFYFETMNATDVMAQSSFMERGRPLTFGADVVVNF